MGSCNPNNQTITSLKNEMRRSALLNIFYLFFKDLFAQIFFLYLIFFF